MRAHFRWNVLLHDDFTCFKHPIAKVCHKIRSNGDQPEVTDRFINNLRSHEVNHFPLHTFLDGHNILVSAQALKRTKNHEKIREKCG